MRVGYRKSGGVTARSGTTGSLVFRSYLPTETIGAVERILGESFWDENTAELRIEQLTAIVAGFSAEKLWKLCDEVRISDASCCTHFSRRFAFHSKQYVLREKL